MFFSNGCTLALTSHFINYLIYCGYDKMASATMASISMIGNAPARVGIGAFVAFRKSNVVLVNSGVLAASGLLLGAIGFFRMPHAALQVAFIFQSVLMGFATSLIVITNGWINDVKSIMRGFSLLGLSLGVGGMAMPSLTGLVYQLTHNYHYGMLFLSGGYMFGAFLLFVTFFFWRSENGK